MQNIDKSILTAPIFFEGNRVGRVYTGGALFADFFGDNSVDGFEPEEWVASSVTALNKISKGPKEGVSKIKGSDIYFDELLSTHKADLLGDRNEFGVLTKVLDSAIRLPVQAHPNKEYSKKYLNSEYGKAESWIVLATRPDAAIYFGFNKEYTKDELKQAVEKSKTDKSVMEKLLNRIPVKTGDVFFVPAKMAHAIGTGCLILEIQEPTDFTIQPEYYCGDYLLDANEMYLGLKPDIALDVFDFSYFGQKSVDMGRVVPKVVTNENGVLVESLITTDHTDCFGVERYTLNSAEFTLTHKPAVYVVTGGEGSVICDGKEVAIKQSDYFFLPFAAKDTKIKSSGNLTVVACLPPQK